MDYNEKKHTMALMLAHVPSEINQDEYSDAIFLIKAIREVDEHFGMGLISEVYDKVPSQWKAEVNNILEELKI